MYFLGLDIGTSFIKASIVDSNTQQEIVSASFPETESPIISQQIGWAEQDPEMWWENVCQCIKKLSVDNDLKLVKSIGIAYQMHGLVMVDKNQKVLRPSIIWCDSRAIGQGEMALKKIGSEKALANLLNFPANFTASKLAWVKANEPVIFDKCDKVMLPGDFIAMKLTGEITTTISGLSEGIFWDFKSNCISKDILKAFDFNESIIPEIKPTFGSHGNVSREVAQKTGLQAGIPISYKAGDQPNNALSLNVIEPGEIAATAGTSGVIYSVIDKINADSFSRINSFAHVNHGLNNQNRIGVLLCINGTGILNRWVRDNVSGGKDYDEMNKMAAKTPVGSNGLKVFPFGNGAERMLKNKMLGAQIIDLDFNNHKQNHIFRASQEGIAFAMNYGFEMMKDLGGSSKIIRAGRANMFLSDIFIDSLVNTSEVAVELINTNGAVGAALGSGVGLGYFSSINEGFSNLKIEKIIEPNASKKSVYDQAYQSWKDKLNELLA